MPALTDVVENRQSTVGCRHAPHRITQIGATRFIAVMFIVFFHYGQNIYPFDSVIAGRLLQLGNAWISYFFVLSGFLLAVGYHNKAIDFKKYFTARFARIYPLYLLALLYYVLLSFNGGNLFSPEVIRSVVLDLLLVQSWVPSYPLSLNSPGWFLSVLCFFYLIFPFFYPKMKDLEYHQLLFFLFLFWLVSLGIFIILRITVYGGYPSLTHDLIFYNPLMHLNAFLVGVGGGIVFKSHSSRREYTRTYFVMVILSSLMVLGVIIADSLSFYHDGLLAPVFAFLVIGLSRDTTFLSRLLSNKLLVFLGEISFAIYIFQAPTHLVLEEKLFPVIGAQNSAYCFYSYLLILIILSSFIHIYIEKPARRFIISLAEA